MLDWACSKPAEIKARMNLINGHEKDVEKRKQIKFFKKFQVNSFHSIHKNGIEIKIKKIYIVYMNRSSTDFRSFAHSS